MYALSSKIIDFPKTLTFHQFEQILRKECLCWLANHFEGLACDQQIIYKKILDELKAHVEAEKCYPVSFFWKRFHTIGKKHKTNFQRMKDKNFGLSESEFNQIIAALQVNNKQLFEQVFLVHFKDCVRYLQHKYQASYDDAYDATMNTFLLFHKKLKAKKIQYGNLRFLFTQMAIQSYLKWIAKNEQKTQSMEGIEREETPLSLDQEQDAALSKAWLKLCKDCQSLLKSFYYEGNPLKALAENLEKSPASLRKQKQRCMIKLRDAFFQFYPLENGK